MESSNKTQLESMTLREEPRVIPQAQTPKPETLFGRLKHAAGAHGEKAIAEVPATLKKLRLLLTVAAVALPLFLVGVIVVLAMALLHVRL